MPKSYLVSLVHSVLFLNPHTYSYPYNYRYANGIIVREYRVGQIIDVQVDVTANHKGTFIFRLCANNNIAQDSDQSCFDR